MAYSTSYSLDRFDASTGILYVSVNILNSSQVTVEVIPLFPIKLPLNSLGEAPTGAALDAHITGVLNRVYTANVLQQKEYLQAAGGIVANASAIYALTSEVELQESLEPVIIGYVFDATGAPIDGVTVTSSNGQSATTDSTGGYIMNVFPGTQTVTVTKNGYFSTFKIVTVAGLTTSIFTMQAESGILSSLSLTGLTSSTVTATGDARVTNNAEVEFPPNAVVDGQGDPVDEAVFEVGNILVSDPGSVDVFPGYFLGDVSGTNEPIESFGYVNLNLQANNGDPLFLDPAVGATVRLPVDPDPVGENSIPVWRLDEATGIWEQTGTATRIGSTNVFEFPVTTFSWYNLDKPLTETCNLTVTVWDTPLTAFNPAAPSGIPAVGVEVTVNTNTNWWGGTTLWQGRCTTDSNGQCVLSVPAGYLEVTGKKGATTYNGYEYQSNTNGGLCTASIDLHFSLPPEVAPPAPINATVDSLVVPSVLFTEEASTLSWTTTDATTINLSFSYLSGPLQAILTNSTAVDSSTTFTPGADEGTYAFTVTPIDENGSAGTTSTSEQIQCVTPIFVLLTADPDYTVGNTATRSVMQVIDSRSITTFSGEFGIDNGNIVQSNGLFLIKSTGVDDTPGSIGIISDLSASLSTWVTSNFTAADFDLNDPGYIGEAFYIQHAPIEFGVSGTATACFAY